MLWLLIGIYLYLGFGFMGMILYSLQYTTYTIKNIYVVLGITFWPYFIIKFVYNRLVYKTWFYLKERK